MKKREFNKLCRIQFGNRKKGEQPPTDEQKHGMLMFVVRNRGPVHRSLVTHLLDMAWFHSMGYLYRDKTFLHTCETRVGLRT